MNIREVARRAKVSRSTVSYALSGKRPVSEATRRRIQQVIDEMGYRPNAFARALARGETRTLGLVFPPAGSHYTDMQLNFIGGVTEAAAARDYDVLLSVADAGEEQSFQRLIGERRVDGAILMEIRLRDARVERMRESGFPFVTIGRTGEPDGTAWVDLDHRTLVRRCVQHLSDLGHRRLAFVNRSETLLRAGYESAHRGQDGFERAVRDLGLTGAAYPCDDDAMAGERCAERILADDPETTGIVTVNEASLGGLYRGLANAGRRIPQDVSVTGIAGARWAEAVTPALTAADVPAHEMGRIAIELLLERVADAGAPPRDRLLTPPVVLRASTGSAPRPAP
ncbi:LacI family DNA-binding transcriptional regulator [Actinoallomurus rhizosphaericola]|uniref:LacI family DNA-binding transcriptional regulator n=1 Tax=Actinoallomurus rhizosphaericola TaxID=2952536 RepID=UPI00209301DD|nr:LacI family DNA-binding transcriptional regulator [Actinoallomurus rhizosphaericola]MCO5997793.1 LacI family transcriptional regulator [Actinoallomurus rhizosphaericola]